MTTSNNCYENITGSKTITPTKKDLSERIDHFLDTILEINLWARYIGLLKFKVPEDFDLPKCNYRKTDHVNVMSHIIQKKQVSGVYKIKTLKEDRISLEQYASGGNWPNATTEEYEIEFWKLIENAGPDSVFNYAQEQAPKQEDQNWGAPLGCVLEHQILPPPIGFGVPVSGITDFYVYLRRCTAFFPAHTENADLFSINIIMPKKQNAVTIWYSIPSADFQKFKNLAATFFVKEFSKNDEYLRKKKVLIHPKFLEEHGIRVTRTVQHVGEGILTLPGAIHFGFSTGANCAIAWNLGPKTWVPYGLDARIEIKKFHYASFDAHELAKLHALRNYGGGEHDEIEVTEKAWKQKRKEYSHYRKGFDPIYPHHQPLQEKEKEIIPRKYIQLSNYWFRCADWSDQSIRYRCCINGCRVSTSLNRSTCMYSDPSPEHKDVLHIFVPDDQLLNLPYNVTL